MHLLSRAFLAVSALLFAASDGWCQQILGFRNDMSSSVRVYLTNDSFSAPAAQFVLRPGEAAEVVLAGRAVLNISAIPLDRQDTGYDFGRHDLNALAALMNGRAVSLKGERVVRLTGTEMGRRGRSRNVYGEVRVAMHLDTFLLLDGRQLRYTAPTTQY